MENRKDANFEKVLIYYLLQIDLQNRDKIGFGKGSDILSAPCFEAVLICEEVQYIA